MTSAETEEKDCGQFEPNFAMILTSTDTKQSSPTEPIFGIPLVLTRYVQRLYSHFSFIAGTLKPVEAFFHTQQSCRQRQHSDIAVTSRISDSQWSGAVDVPVQYVLSDLGEKELYLLCTPTQLLGPKS